MAGRVHAGLHNVTVMPARLLWHPRESGAGLGDEAHVILQLQTILLHFNATCWWVITRLADTTARQLQLVQQLAVLSVNAAMQPLHRWGGQPGCGPTVYS